MEEKTREFYRAGMSAFEGIAPEYHIELRDRPTMVWDFPSLLLAIQMMFSFMLVDEASTLKLCPSYYKAFFAENEEDAVSLKLLTDRSLGNVEEKFLNIIPCLAVFSYLQKNIDWVEKNVEDAIMDSWHWRILDYSFHLTMVTCNYRIWLTYDLAVLESKSFSGNKDCMCW